LFKSTQPIFVLLVVFVLGITASCSRSDGAYMVMFSEKDGVSASAPTRMIVTDKFMRIDDGINNNDFLLYDRAQKTIYSVAAENRAILIIEPQVITVKPPKEFKHEVKTFELKDSPDIDGKKVTRYTLSTNGKRCYVVFAAKGLMEEVRQALIEYREVLAGEQAAMSAFVPLEFQTGCDLANNVFLPARHLEYGLPVRMEDMTGKVRNLGNYEKNYKADPVLFTLPADYSRYTPAQMRNRESKAKSAEETPGT